MAIDLLDPATFNITIERGVSYGPIVFVCYSAGRVVDLTGFTAHAQVRVSADDPILLDLQPVITDEPGGKIQLGAYSSDTTLAFMEIDGIWSLVIENSDGNWLPEIVTGTCVITSSVTRDEP